MQHSIADLEKYSGVKAHTIRMWEQRYGLLSPQRTETNIRFYSDDQLRKLLNVAALVRCGMRISKISALSSEDISQKLDEFTGEEGGEHKYMREINDLLMSALTYDEAAFHKVFADCLIRYGLEDTYTKILSPVMFRTGLMWSKSEMEVCQEHFISNLIRQKLFTAADKLADPREDAKTWLLFLPETEEHEIGLLYANVLIRQYGDRAVYLGPRVPMGDLSANVGQIAPNYMLTFVKHSANKEWVQKYIGSLAERFSDYRVIVAGAPWLFEDIVIPDGVQTLSNPDVLLDIILDQKMVPLANG